MLVTSGSIGVFILMCVVVYSRFYRLFHIFYDVLFTVSLLFYGVF